MSRMLPPNCSPQQNHSLGILNVFNKLHKTIAHGLTSQTRFQLSLHTNLTSLYTEPCRGSYVIHGYIKCQLIN